MSAPVADPLALRGAGAVALGLVLAIGGPVVLGLLSFALLPGCSYGDAPPALVASCLVMVGAAGVGPVLVAGARLWWVGVPAAAIAVYGLMPMVSTLLTERQSGFCF